MRTLTALLTCLLLSSVAHAHVEITAPADEARLEVGSETTIRWRIVIEHTVQFWHVELSDDGGSEWEPVAMELSPGTLSYVWSVPEVACADCLLRVTMDNVGTNYDDTITVRIGAPGGGDPDSDMDAGVADTGPDPEPDAGVADMPDLVAPDSAPDAGSADIGIDHAGHGHGDAGDSGRDLASDASGGEDGVETSDSGDSGEHLVDVTDTDGTETPDSGDSGEHLVDVTDNAEGGGTPDVLIEPLDDEPAATSDGTASTAQSARDDDGCGCGVTATPELRPFGTLLGMLLVIGVVRRRARRWGL
jgi:MYXO-CTERM domain-containing protein